MVLEGDERAAEQVGVELHIHHGPVIPYVMIEHLNPNSFTNGKFIRSLVYQIQRTYREMFQRDIITEVYYDDSSIIVLFSYCFKSGFHHLQADSRCLIPK